MLEQASMQTDDSLNSDKPEFKGNIPDLQWPKPTAPGATASANTFSRELPFEDDEFLSEAVSVESSRSGSSISVATPFRSACISRAESGEDSIPTPHGSGIVCARNVTPSPFQRRVIQPSSLRKSMSHLHLAQQQEADPDNALRQQAEANFDNPIPIGTSALSHTSNAHVTGSNTAELLQECADRLIASKLEDTQAPPTKLTQSIETASLLAPLNQDSIAIEKVNQKDAAPPNVKAPVTELIAPPLVASSSETQINDQPKSDSLLIDIDQAPPQLSWRGIGRRTIAWVNYILTGFDVRDDSQENRVYRLQEKLIAHEIKQILPHKISDIDAKLSKLANLNEQRTYLLQKILKIENKSSITKLREEEKQRAADETNTEQQNYNSAKIQLVNELNALYAKIQSINPNEQQFKQIDNSNITHEQIEVLYQQLMCKNILEHPTVLYKTAMTAKVKFDAAKKELMDELNIIRESQAQKIEASIITSSNLEILRASLLQPEQAQKYQETIDNLLDTLNEEYDKDRKGIIHRHYEENKKTDRQKEQSKKTDREKLAYELKLLDEELARKKARYIELLRLLEMDVDTLKKTYAQLLANKEKKDIKKSICAQLQLDSLSLQEQEFILKKELDRKNANPRFTKENVLWGITQSTTTIVAASSGTVTAVACTAITIFTYHISVPFLLIIGWAGYRVNFSVYQDSIKNTLNSFFKTGLFHDPKYPNDLTKKVGPIKKVFMSLGTFFATGAGVSISAITFTSVSHCLLHLLLLFSFTAAAAIPPVIIPIAGVIAVISLIAITALMFNTISNIIKNDNNAINQFCRKLYRKGFKKCCTDAVEDLKFFFQHLTAKDVIHGVTTALFMVIGIAFATLATIALISSWHSSLVWFLENTAGIRDIVTSGIANGIALVACYCLTPVARFPVVLEKAAITFGLIAHSICHPKETYDKCAKKLHAFKEQAKAECIDVPSTALFVGKSVLIGACYLVAVTIIVGFIALNAIGNGALADEGGKILDSICGWFGANLPLVGQSIASFSSAATVSAAFAIVATQDTYGRPVESRESEMKKLTANNQVGVKNSAINLLADTASPIAKREVNSPSPTEEDLRVAREKTNPDASTKLLDESQTNKNREVDSWFSPGIAKVAATLSCGMWTNPYEVSAPAQTPAAQTHTAPPRRDPAITSYYRMK